MFTKNEKLLIVASKNSEELIFKILSKKSKEELETKKHIVKSWVIQDSTDIESFYLMLIECGALDLYSLDYLDSVKQTYLDFDELKYCNEMLNLKVSKMKDQYFLFTDNQFELFTNKTIFELLINYAKSRDYQNHIDKSVKDIINPDNYKNLQKNIQNLF